MTKIIVLAAAALALVASCGADRNAPTTMTRTSALARRPELPQHDSIRVVALGDSLAYGTGDESGRGGISGRLKDDLRAGGFASVETLNLGVNGAQTSDLIGRLGEQRFRDRIANADAIILSIGANDLWRTERGRQEVMNDPIGVASGVLDRIQDIVSDLHQAAPHARIMILGGYNPVPKHPLAPMINHYLEIWNATLVDRFKDDPLVSVVKMDDVVTPQRLSRYDGFHPGAAAYDAAAKRIASMLASPTA